MVKLPKPEDIAKEICSVQPMPPDTFKKLYEASTPKEQLEKEGYRSVSGLGLLWVKNESKNS